MNCWEVFGALCPTHHTLVVTRLKFCQTIVMILLVMHDSLAQRIPIIVLPSQLMSLMKPLKRCLYGLVVGAGSLVARFNVHHRRRPLTYHLFLFIHRHGLLSFRSLLILIVCLFTECYRAKLWEDATWHHIYGILILVRKSDSDRLELLLRAEMLWRLAIFLDVKQISIRREWLLLLQQSQAFSFEPRMLLFIDESTIGELSRDGVIFTAFRVEWGISAVDFKPIGADTFLRLVQVATRV